LPDQFQTASYAHVISVTVVNEHICMLPEVESALRLLFSYKMTVADFAFVVVDL